MHNHLIIFARVPRFGVGKKRLANEVGPLTALQFQRENLSSLLRRVGKDPRWITWLALTPKAGEYTPPIPIRKLIQPKGNLGQRMGVIMRHMPPGPALVIGNDIPGILCQDVYQAFQMLRTHDAVLGPAMDGGYWAIGLRRRYCFVDPFANVRWSTKFALDDTLKNMQGLRVGYLRSLRDVDTATDLILTGYRRGRS
jgi:rSAM/selenodomain-associated transferase 1